MKRFLLAICLLAMPTIITPAASNTDAAVKADARLDQRVSIKTAGKPLGDFLSLVSEATGVRMTAREDVADYRVCMYVKDIPLFRLQDALKKVLHLQYTREGNPGDWSYEFWEDAVTRQEADRLKKEELDRLRAAVQKLADDLELPEDELIAKFGRKKDMPYAFLYPWCRSLLRAHSFVDKRQLDELWQKGTLRLGKADISSELQRELLRGLNEEWSELDMGEPTGESGQPEEADTPDYPNEYYHANEWTAVDSIDFKIEDSASESGMRLAIYVAGASIDIAGPNPEDRKASRSEQNISVGPKEYENTPAADPVEAWLSGETQAITEPEWPISRYVEDPSLGMELPHDEDGEYAEDSVVEEQPVAEAEDEYVPPVTHYQMLMMIAERTGANIVSDRFATVDVPAWAVSEKPGDWPLSVIDKLAEGMNADTTKDGNLWLLVNREWSRNRDREVPERLVKRWMPTAKKLGYLDLEQIIELSALTDAQIMSLPSYGLPSAGEVTGDRVRLHLLASLTPAQWIAIKSEKGLPISSLSEQQQQDLLDWQPPGMRALDDDEASPPGEMEAIKISPDYLDWDDNGRKVKVWHFSECRGKMEDITGLPSAIYEEDGNGYGAVTIEVAGKT